MSDAEKKHLPHLLRETWMNALGVLHGAESEVAKTAHRVLESMGIPIAPAAPGDEGAAQLPEVKAVVREIFVKVQRNRADLERRLDEGVRATVDRLRRPFAQELDQVRARIDKLQQRVDGLRRPRSGDGPSKKPPDSAE